MRRKTNGSKDGGTQITIDIPLQDSRLFGGNATDDVLLFLSRHHDESFSISDIARAVEYSRPTVTKTVDTLAGNDLVVEDRVASKRMVHINRDRLSRPDDPILEIPQQDFQKPVQVATNQIADQLEGVLAVVLFGSIARGEADRRSDIDLWVLVSEDRMANQRTANTIREHLEDRAFDGDRYAFEIDVEALQAVPNYTDELREILRDGIPVYQTNEFLQVRNMVMHGESNE